MADDDEAVEEAGGAKSKAKKKAKRSRKRRSSRKEGRPTGVAAYPRHSVRKALRIPRAVLEQNAGKACSDREAAKFAGLAYHGPAKVEVSSAIKYGLLERPGDGQVAVTDLAKKILRPQKPNDELDGLRQAILNAPMVADIYKHYRGENIPDEQFFRNALVDTFGLREDKVDEFKSIFQEDLDEAQLVEDVGGKKRILDIARDAEPAAATDQTLKKISKGVKIEHGDSCFVMMPFADPIGGYYKSIYEPAILKAGLKAVRADDEIFATGKIIDSGGPASHLRRSSGGAHRKKSKRVLRTRTCTRAEQARCLCRVESTPSSPFDPHDIRVIYYDMRDPFWGEKLVAKVSENIVSALKNPGGALLKRAVESAWPTRARQRPGKRHARDGQRCAMENAEER